MAGLDLVFGRALAAEGNVIPEPLVQVVECDLGDHIGQSDAHRDGCVPAKYKYYQRRGDGAEQAVADSFRYAPGVRFHFEQSTMQSR
jgi:hypothetical protein